MAQLPLFQTQIKELSLMQTKWTSVLNPLIANVANQSSILTKVSLINGTTTINHLLGHTLNGWSIVRQRASAIIYDSQDSNSTPALTLVLVSSAAVVVDILVF